ncbi:hypothetical protein HID58_095872 [Brassica napus]|uniref:DNA-directed RNA polymerase n=1 Tax=Brassica napus TaxID=3708 RepID=A0ABQ7X244_BRANA|nr:hypothetical protein HID58_095872 [Brassica napus]
MFIRPYLLSPPPSSSSHGFPRGAFSFSLPIPNLSLSPQTSLVTWLKPPSSSALFRRKPTKRLLPPISAASSSSSSTSLSPPRSPPPSISTETSSRPSRATTPSPEPSKEPPLPRIPSKGTNFPQRGGSSRKTHHGSPPCSSRVKEETEAWERMVEEYRDLEKEMCEKSLAPNLPYVKHMFLGWFQPLKEVIEREQRLQKNKSKKMMGLVMSGHEDGCIQVVQAAVSIGIAIEHEVRIHNFLKRTRKNNAGDSQEELKDKQLLRKRVNSLIRRKRIIDALKVVKSEGIKPWGRATQAKLGSRLLELLMETAYVQPPLTQSGDSIPEFRPAFRHKFKTVTKYPGSKLVRRYGVIECDSLLLAGLDKSAKHMLIPYVPMLVPPKRWRGYDKGGYLFLPSYIMRTHGSKKQQDALKDISSKTAHRVFEALDTLGNTKWRVNRKILDVVERLWADGGNIAGLVNREDVPIPEKPSSEDPEELQSWKWSVRKAKKTNRERHSLRCDVELKLSVARKMKDEEGFYYPHNLDFRGRAYPMHPHLNHLSSDLCRGTLEFAEGRPLGKSGLYWLKIHLANLYAGGVEKLSHEGRLAFVENHLDDIMDSAENAIHGRRWWLKAEDPFQCLAACVVLAQALKSPSPYSVISHLPIHQDGSCNGLQHYAALGRDSVVIISCDAVNTFIRNRVHEIMKKDSSKDPESNPTAALAKILINQVDRKLVKQTVMTSVYGVTYVGAREQIKRRLEEKGVITDERMLFSAACYSAKVTLAALGEIFEAHIIATDNHPVRWTTPLGLPVVQPYCRSERHLIRTSLQVLALQREGNTVDVRKQRTAFPPNFVHSLDGTHMMMTAVACREAGLNFAGVHDSYWTHACDVDTMNRIYLERNSLSSTAHPSLKITQSFQESYPNLVFPPVPKRGGFDLKEVLKSQYFFN